MVSLKHLTQGFLHLLYPQLCEGCNKPILHGEDILCIGCIGELPLTGYHDNKENDTALRFSGRIPFFYATSFAYFTNDGILQHLLHALKYRNKQQIGYFLGKQFGEDLNNCEWITSIDLIIPVPLHIEKMAKRGFNQSLLIAEGMSEVLHVPVNAHSLIRIKDTESQTKKTRTDRIENMTDAFEVTDKQELTGKHILLFDDVLTTGATLESCFLALAKQENIKISLATIGIAVS